jgi:hypothetical protein
LLLVPFLLDMELVPEARPITIRATPLVKACANGVPEWGASGGTLVVLAPYAVRVIPDGHGTYDVWANIPETICGGYIVVEY